MTENLSMEDVHEKIKKIKELKSNPLVDVREIGKLRTELALVDMNKLTPEEKHVLTD